MVLINKKITPQELAENLVNSRKIINKLDTGNYKKRNINEQLIIDNDNIDIDNIDIDNTINQNIPKIDTSLATIDKITQSKLPDAIKQAMIEHPIPQISLNDSLDISITERSKKIMEKEGLISPTKSKIIYNQKNSGYSTSLNESKLQNLIENAVRKVLDEKLNQILSAQQLSSINENLVLKVGDSIFQGKITAVKKHQKR